MGLSDLTKSYCHDEKLNNKKVLIFDSDAIVKNFVVVTDTMARDLKCKVYVGDLGYGAAKEELEEKFSKYGPLRSVWVARKPPGFAFVEFEDSRDAADAVRALDGTLVKL